ncbi:unnamed protein product [Bursaphelenchus xylophilus]|uniref:(pine wood nematode) hypothetical protein n=1 Tax=Bursaphelenchus xylophilus TaxID=6326 RepID=A0A1I7S991_BURXY|nr:unnamed protein product [Bursaphelenchus xylophilus]CAG9100449.1 unnamed protein product [Bursaphelenchus xylophilus]
MSCLQERALESFVWYYHCFKNDGTGTGISNPIIRLMRIGSRIQGFLKDFIRQCKIKVFRTEFYIEFTFILHDTCLNISATTRDSCDLLWFRGKVTVLVVELNKTTHLEEKRVNSDLPILALSTLLESIFSADYLALPQFLANLIPCSATVKLLKVIDLQKVDLISCNARFLEIDLISSENIVKAMRIEGHFINRHVQFIMLTISDIIAYELVVMRTIQRLLTVFPNATKIFVNYCGDSQLFASRFDSTLGMLRRLESQHLIKLGLVCNWKLGDD